MALGARRVELVLSVARAHYVPAVEKVNALTTNPGRLVLTNARLYFQPFNNVYHDPVYKYRLSAIANVVTRRYLLREKVCGGEGAACGAVQWLGMRPRCTLASHVQMGIFPI
jgi:hypothetical protein